MRLGKSIFASFLKGFIAFFVSYFTLNLMFSLLRINYISQINLSVFIALLSLLLVIILYLFMNYEFGKETILRMEILSKRKFWFLISIVPLLIGVYWLVNMEKYRLYGITAFQYWNSLPVEDILFIIVIYCYLLYVPSYLIEKIFLKDMFSLHEKIIFYPTMGMMTLGFLGFLLPSIIEIWALKFILPFLFSSLLFILKFRKNNNQISVFRLNPAEIVSLILVITFRVLIYISTLGENLFPKQDMIYQAGYVARINRYGMITYLSVPLTERYPVFYFCAWSSMSKFLPLPYLNILVLTSLFSHVLVTLSFYILAKKLLKDYRKALFSTFALVALSGFSWLYILIDPPIQQLSTQDLYNYVLRIQDKFGMYSGSTVSTIYADTHALVRLWSLNVFFTSLYALSSFYSNIKNKKGYLFVFLAGFLQIALGHTPELLLIGLSLFTLTLLARNDVFKNIFKWIIALTFICLSFMFMLSYPKQCIILLFCPIILFMLAVSSHKFLTLYMKITNKTLFRLLGFIMLCVVWYYGIAIITFAYNYNSVNIRFPIFTLWYTPPIQWGFLGLLFVITLLKSTYIDKRMDFGLSFNLSMLSLLGIFIVFLNCVNLHSYVDLPYPIMPIYFFPFFALTSGYLLENKEAQRSNNWKRILIASLIIIIFIFGSICHVISASYWREKSWWGGAPLTAAPSLEEIQILNILYATSPLKHYEEICFIPRNQPYPNVEGTIYQLTVRYRTFSETYLIRLSGFTPCSRLVESGLFDTKNINEVYFLLNHFSPARFVLVEKGTESSIVQLMKNETFFEGGKYQIYELPQLPIKILDGVLVEKISFNGSLSISRGYILKNVSGELIPLDEGYVLVHNKHIGNLTIQLPSNLIFEGNITLFNVRATRLYFSEASNVGKKITFYGNLSTVLLASFDSSHLYLTSLKYAGTYSIYPSPWHMTLPEAVRLIHAYIRTNEIPFLSILSAPVAELWTVTIVLIIVAGFYLTRVKVRFKREEGQPLSTF